MRLNEVFSPLVEDVGGSHNVLAQYDAQIREYFKEGQFIYRGIRTDDPVIVGDGSNLNRVASETYNFVNMLVSEMLPEWSKYPPRNKSFICTTELRGTTSYGRLYYVIPLENQTVGICPKSDFWGSFGSSPRIMVDVLNDAIFALSMQQNKTALTDASQVMEALKKCDEMKKDKDFLEYVIKHEERELTQKIMSMIAEYNGSTYELCREKLDPESNGFQHKNWNDFVPRNAFGVEVWLSGKVLMLAKRVANQYMDKQYETE